MADRKLVYQSIFEALMRARPNEELQRLQQEAIALEDNFSKHFSTQPTYMAATAPLLSKLRQAPIAAIPELQPLAPAAAAAARPAAAAGGGTARGSVVVSSTEYQNAWAQIDAARAALLPLVTARLEGPEAATASPAMLKPLQYLKFVLTCSRETMPPNSIPLGTQQLEMIMKFGAGLLSGSKTAGAAAPANNAPTSSEAEVEAKIAPAKPVEATESVVAKTLGGLLGSFRGSEPASFVLSPLQTVDDFPSRLSSELARLPSIFVVHRDESYTEYLSDGAAYHVSLVDPALPPLPPVTIFVPASYPSGASFLAMLDDYTWPGYFSAVRMAYRETADCNRVSTVTAAMHTWAAAARRAFEAEISSH